MQKQSSPRIHWAWWLLGIALLLAWQYWPRDAAPSQATQVEARQTPAHSPTQSSPAASLPVFLPAEAHTTISLIQRGGPFPHRQDGAVFGNREGHPPRQPRGWYREYTVDTPNLSHRGARRIVTGGNPPQTWHYTSDHYDSFRAFNPGTASGISP